LPAPAKGRRNLARSRPEGDGQNQIHFEKRDYVDDMNAVADGCDALVVATEWDEFKKLDLERAASHSRIPSCSMAATCSTRGNGTAGLDLQKRRAVKKQPRVESRGSKATASRRSTLDLRPSTRHRRFRRLDFPRRQNCSSPGVPPKLIWRVVGISRWQARTG